MISWSLTSTSSPCRNFVRNRSQVTSAFRITEATSSFGPFGCERNRKAGRTLHPAVAGTEARAPRPDFSTSWEVVEPELIASVVAERSA